MNSYVASSDVKGSIKMKSWHRDGNLGINTAVRFERADLTLISAINPLGDAHSAFDAARR